MQSRQKAADKIASHRVCPTGIIELIYLQETEMRGNDLIGFGQFMVTSIHVE
jgi:hypothetical protein